MIAKQGQLLGEGRIAEVFAWGEHDVVKLLRPDFSPEEAEYEAKIAQIVSAAGKIGPEFRGLTTVDGRAGILYERLDGPSLQTQLLFGALPVNEGALILAETHVALYECKVADLPPLREVLEWRIRRADPLPAFAREAALRTLETLPDGDTLCHGDFHPGNVMLTSRGPVIIDWENAARGHPLADVARTLLLLRMADASLDGEIVNGDDHLSVKQAIVRLAAAYLRRYRQLAPFRASELTAWRLPVVAARLSEGVTQEEERLVALVSSLARNVN